MLQAQQKQPNVLPLDTIQKIVDTQDWVKLVEKRQRILISLQVLRNEFEEKVQQQLETDIMPKVYDLIDQFLIKNDLSLVGFFNLDVISVCTVDKQQYSEFVNGNRYEAPKLQWEKFEELQELLKAELNARIVGSKNPQTGMPTWTIRTNIPKNLVEEFAPVKVLIDTVKAKYLEIDQANAKQSEEIEEESAYKEADVEEKDEVDDIKKEEVGEIEEPSEEALKEGEKLSDEEKEKIKEEAEPVEFKEEPAEAPGLKN